MAYYDDLELLRKYGIPVARSEIVRDIKELGKAIENWRYPVVLKIDTQEPIHKTEIGGVKVVENESDYHEFVSNIKRLKKKVGIRGIIIQEVATGIEVIIGGKRDSQFGPIVLFGLGGVFVEILQDFSLRLCPLTKRDAKYMIREIRGYPVLAGARGTKPVNERALIDAIISVANIMVERKEIKEIDINPLFANPEGVMAVDIRIVRGD